MKIKLIVGCAGLFVSVCAILWSLWQVSFKKPPVKLYMKRYTWRLTAGIIAYALGLVVINQLYTPGSPRKYWLILLPVLPIVYIVVAIVRAVTEMDEMKRKIFTEAAAFACLATGFSCFTYLFFRDMGAPEFHGEWAFY